MLTGPPAGVGIFVGATRNGSNSDSGPGVSAAGAGGRVPPAAGMVTLPTPSSTTRRAMPTVGRVRTYSLCPSCTGKALPARSRDPVSPVEHVTDPRGHVPRPAQDHAGN